MKATDLSCAPLDMFVTRGVDKTPGGARWRARDLQSVGCRDDGRARERFKRSAESDAGNNPPMIESWIRRFCYM